MRSADTSPEHFRRKSSCSPGHTRTQSASALRLDLDAALEVELPPVPKSCNSATTKEIVNGWEKVTISDAAQVSNLQSSNQADSSTCAPDITLSVLPTTLSYTQWHSPKATGGLNARTANLSSCSLASTSSETTCSDERNHLFAIGTMND